MAFTPTPAGSMPTPDEVLAQLQPEPSDQDKTKGYITPEDIAFAWQVFLSRLAHHDDTLTALQAAETALASRVTALEHGAGAGTVSAIPFALKAAQESALPAVDTAGTLLVALDTGQWFLSDGTLWNRLGLDPTTVLGNLNAALHRTDALRQDVDALKAQTVALDDLTDVAAPSTTPAGKVLGTTATGAWGPVDPPQGSGGTVPADVVRRGDIVGMDPVPYDPAHAYAEGDVIIYNGSWWVAKQPTTAGQDPTSNPGKWLVLDLEATALKASHAANGAVPDAATPADDGKVLTAQGGVATWAKAPLPPLPLVVKDTQPTAADYHETTIPDGAVWLKRKP